MTKEMIGKLMAKGVPSDVILELFLDDEESEIPEEAVQHDEQPATKTEKEPEQASQQEDRILAAIEKLTGAIYAGNIARDGFDAKKEGTDEILAAILRGGAPDGQEK